MPVSSLSGKVETEAHELFANSTTSQIIYSGNQSSAKEKIEEIKKWILSDQETLLKTGTLRLVKTGKDSYQLKRHQWYHDFCFWNRNDAQKDAVTFIESLFKTAYPQEANTDSKGQSYNLVNYLIHFVENKGLYQITQ
ncbi:MAG: hypothetical protein ACOYK6_05850 [Chthoniobacterales bacterium]